MTTWICTRTDELQHHGIKGQRWGIRRFQNKDGSLTPAGRRRYDEPNSGRKFVQKTSESVTIDGQTFKVYGRNNKQYADKVAKKAKNMGATVSRESKSKAKDMGINVSRESETKEPKKYKIPENKSLHRLQLEEKYRKQGMSQEEAEQAAAKRIKTELFVAAAAVTTVAACVAYNKHKDFTTDKIFKENTEFQRIMRLSPDAEIRDGRQYLAIDKRDKAKYKGLLGDTFKKAIDLDNQVNEAVDLDPIADKVYNVTVKNRKELRVAAEKNARDVFEKLYSNDSDFKKGIDSAFKDNGFMFTQNSPKLQKMLNKFEKNGKLTDRELKSHGYDLFNIMLMDKTEQGEKNANKFYDAIRKAGYNAIIDVNDKKYSGYKSKMPIIAIDDGFDYAKRAMSNEEIASFNKQELRKLMAPEVLKLGAMGVAYFGTAPVLSKVDMDKRVLKYKAEHPNTNMSNAEIKAMIKEQLLKELEDANS